MSVVEVCPSPKPEMRPAVASDTELLGEYSESGFREPCFLARRADGQVVQLSRLLYLVADAADGESDCDQIANSVTERFGRRVSPGNVTYLIEQKLVPCGVLTTGPGPAVGPAPDRSAPLLALKFRVPLVPQGMVGPLSRVLSPLFAPPVVAAFLAGLVYFDWWLFGHGLSSGLVQILSHPTLMLMILGCTLASAVFHELGHATACRASGGQPGAIGAGLYLVMPALYTDVTDSYRLGRAGRLRTDVGGVYFNAVAVLMTAGGYAATRFEPLLVLAVLIQFEIVQQFIPFVRLDGYWMISDLIGVPDLFGRIRPILLSLVPGRPADRRVTELKTKARVVVTAWVCTTVPLLCVNVFLIGRSAPHLAAVGWATASTQFRILASSATGGRPLTAVMSAVDIVLVALPIVTGLLTSTWISYRCGFAASHWTACRPKPKHRRRRAW